MHAGRSRNDQVAVATRLWAKDAARELALAVAGAQEALVACARANEGVVLPGYTHLQRAQPVLLGHHLAAHAWMLERDAERLRAAYASADECPLGAGALAGSSLPLDPQWTAAQLGFARSFDNTLDAVADRDFICDLLYACALGFVHLSRLAEEVIVFTTQEFAFAQLDDTIALGSSMMPQKKNPQVAEHLRGRAGVAIGRLAAMLAVCKGLPLAYDSDLQEDKELAFAQVAAYDGALRATALLVGGPALRRRAHARGRRRRRVRRDRRRRGARARRTAVPRGARAGGVAHRRRRALRRADAGGGRRRTQRPGRNRSGTGRGAARGAHLARRGDARLGQGVTALGSPWPITAREPGRGPRARRGALRRSSPRASARRSTSTTPPRCASARGPTSTASPEHPDAHVSFACKACCTVGVLRLLGDCGLGADVASAGELAAALRAGIEPARIVVHGNGKTDADIDAAVAAGCGLLVLDGLDEGARVAAAAERHGRRQPVAVRVTPGIVAGGHEKIATGHEGSKFGLAPADAARACLEAREDPRLDWRGLHVHLGSQVDDAGVLEGVVRWFREFCDAHALEPRLIDVGGGLGIPYGIGVGARRARARRGGRGRRAAPLPGRAAPDRAGPLGRRALRASRSTARSRARPPPTARAGSRSTAAWPTTPARRSTARATPSRRPVGSTSRPAERVSLAGRHCESGDVLAHDVDLPPLAAGDLVAFAATGAYTQSMASTYNAIPRLAAVLVDDGEARLLTRRETIAELLARDL